MGNTGTPKTVEELIDEIVEGKAVSLSKGILAMAGLRDQGCSHASPEDVCFATPHPLLERETFFATLREFIQMIDNTGVRVAIVLPVNEGEQNNKDGNRKGESASKRGKALAKLLETNVIGKLDGVATVTCYNDHPAPDYWAQPGITQSQVLLVVAEMKDLNHGGSASEIHDYISVGGQRTVILATSPSFMTYKPNNKHSISSALPVKASFSTYLLLTGQRFSGANGSLSSANLLFSTPAPDPEKDNSALIAEHGDISKLFFESIAYIVKDSGQATDEFVDGIFKSADDDNTGVRVLLGQDEAEALSELASQPERAVPADSAGERPLLGILLDKAEEERLPTYIFKGDKYLLNERVGEGWRQNERPFVIKHERYLAFCTPDSSQYIEEAAGCSYGAVVISDRMASALDWKNIAGSLSLPLSGETGPRDLLMYSTTVPSSPSGKTVRPFGHPSPIYGRNYSKSGRHVNRNGAKIREEHSETASQMYFVSSEKPDGRELDLLDEKASTTLFSTTLDSVLEGKWKDRLNGFAAGELNAADLASFLQIRKRCLPNAEPVKMSYVLAEKRPYLPAFRFESFTGEDIEEGKTDFRRIFNQFSRNKADASNKSRNNDIATLYDPVLDEEVTKISQGIFGNDALSKEIEEQESELRSAREAHENGTINIKWMIKDQEEKIASLRSAMMASASNGKNLMYMALAEVFDKFYAVFQEEKAARLGWFFSKECLPLAKMSCDLPADNDPAHLDADDDACLYDGHFKFVSKSEHPDDTWNSDGEHMFVEMMKALANGSGNPVRFWFENKDNTRSHKDERSFSISYYDHSRSTVRGFYPDFGIMLNDGRFYWVELKGGTNADGSDNEHDIENSIDKLLSSIRHSHEVRKTAEVFSEDIDEHALVENPKTVLPSRSAIDSYGIIFAGPHKSNDTGGRQLLYFVPSATAPGEELTDEHLNEIADEYRKQHFWDDRYWRPLEELFKDQSR